MAKVSYKHCILCLSSAGFLCMFSLRSAFVMTVTHTVRLHNEDNLIPQDEEKTNYSLLLKVSLRGGAAVGGQRVDEYRASSLYHGCTVYKSSRDFESDYGWSMSVLFYSVYYLGMAIGCVAVGFILSNMSANRVMMVAWYAAAILQLLLPPVFKVSGYAVAPLRFVNGFADSLVQPSFTSLTKNWAFQGEESTFLSIGVMGCFLSPALASFFVGACLCYISWDAALYILSCLLLFLTILWHLLSYDSPLDCPHISKTDRERYENEQRSISKNDGNKSKGRKVPWRQILTSKPVWAIWFANANKNSNLAAVSSLVPLYFKDVYGIRAADSGLLLIGPFVANTISLLASSQICDRIIRSGAVSTTTARKLFQCVGSAGEAVFLICTIYVHDWRLAVVSLTLAQIMTGMCFPGFGCNNMDLTPHFSGAVMGVTSTGMFMVFVTTGVASLIPDDGGAPGGLSKWTVVFWINAAIAALSSVCYLMFASGEVQPWGLDKGEEGYTEINICDCTPHSLNLKGKPKLEEPKLEKAGLLTPKRIY